MNLFFLRKVRKAREILFSFLALTQVAAASEGTLDCRSVLPSITPPELTGFHHFEVLSLKGTGSFSRVWEVVSGDNQDQKFALKQIFDPDQQQKEVLAHSNIQVLLKTLSGKDREIFLGGWPVKGSLKIEGEKVVEGSFILMPLADGNLQDEMAKLSLVQVEDPSERIRRVKKIHHLMVQMKLALGRLHDLGLAHGDITLANIMVKESSFFLGDFGSLASKTSSPKETAWERFYGPLEFEAEFDSTAKIDLGLADFFSLGVVLFKLMTGLNPFHLISLSTDYDSYPLQKEPKLIYQLREKLAADLQVSSSRVEFWNEKMSRSLGRISKRWQKSESQACTKSFGENQLSELIAFTSAALQPLPDQRRKALAALR